MLQEAAKRNSFLTTYATGTIMRNHARHHIKLARAP